MRFLIGLAWTLPLVLAGACARPGLEPDPIATDDGGDGTGADAGGDDDQAEDDGDQSEDEDQAEPGDDGDDDEDDADEESAPGEDAGAAGRDAGGANEDAQVEPSPDCENAELPDELAVGTERVTAIRINGAAGTQADVAPGSSVRLEFEVNFQGCEMLIGPPKEVYLGFEVASMECRPALCSRFNPSASFEFMLQAPSQPGLHYVAISIAESRLCTDGANTDTRLAALCVVP